MSAEGDPAVAGLDKPAATLDLVAQSLRLAREAGGGCLILGAGASVSAGVPTAAGMVALIRERFPETYRLATEDGSPPSYHRLLGWLSEGERARLIGDVLDQARLNWEHLVIADLMARGFIGPVLTVNFDRLLIAACARVNVQPAVYDLAGGSEVPAAAAADGPTVVYLHGLGDRSSPPASAAERAAYRRRIEPMVRHLLYRGLPIVALGFRGENDPLVEILADHGRFANRLFWVGHYDHPPAPAVRKILDAPGNDALFLSGFDAEGFAIGLARKLDAFPPRVLADPLGETVRVWSAVRPPRDAEVAAPLEAALAMLASKTPPPPPASPPAPEAAPPPPSAPMKETTGVAETAKKTERTEEAAAKTATERPESPPVAPPAPPAAAEETAPEAPEAEAETSETVTEPETATEAPAVAAAASPAPTRARAEEPGATPSRLRLVVGDYERLVEDYAAGRLDDDSREAVAWAYVMLANDDARQAQALRGPRAEALWARAMEKYAKAIEVDPHHADALYNWAGALATRAQGLDGEAAAAAWAAAIEKYEAMLALRPRDAEALGDCARALVGRARLVADDEAGALIDKALDRLEAAYQLGDDTAYVGYLEVALAHGRHKAIARFLESPPPKLPDPVRFALALVYLVFVLEQGLTPELAPFDELPRLDRSPCEDWDFADIEPAIQRLPERAAAFVRATIDVLQGARPLADWPSIRDAWLAGRNPPTDLPAGVTALR